MTGDKSTSTAMRNVIEIVLGGMMLAALTVASWVGNEARMELVKVGSQQSAQAEAIHELKVLIKENKTDWTAQLSRHEERIDALEVANARRE